MNFDVRCDRCGETGTINRMDIKAGVCIYCRSEAETSAPPTEPSELDTLRAQNAELLAALERLILPVNVRGASVTGDVTLVVGREDFARARAIIAQTKQAS